MDAVRLQRKKTDISERPGWEVKSFGCGHRKMRFAKHMIESGVDPAIPQTWNVSLHKYYGLVDWDPAKVVLYTSLVQKICGRIIGDDLWEEIKDKPALNATILDYLFRTLMILPRERHDELIPELWKSYIVLFWGTRYVDPGGTSLVRGLSWNKGWQTGYYPVSPRLSLNWQFAAAIFGEGVYYILDQNITL